MNRFVDIVEQVKNFSLEEKEDLCAIPGCIPEHVKKITARDLAFGIGRTATSEELKELLSHPVAKLQDGRKVLKEIKAHLKSRREK